MSASSTIPVEPTTAVASAEAPGGGSAAATSPVVALPVVDPGPDVWMVGDPAYAVVGPPPVPPALLPETGPVTGELVALGLFTLVAGAWALAASRWRR